MMARVLFVGTEGCGKTVLLTVMARAFRDRSNQHKIHMLPSNLRTAAYVEDKFRYLLAGEWPPSTPQGDMQELEWKLEVDGYQPLDLQFVDPPGQELRRLYGDEDVNRLHELPQHLQELAKRVSSADAVAFLVNLGDFLGEADSSKQLSTQWTIRFGLDKLPPDKPWCLVFTQMDQYRAFVKQQGGLEPVVEKYLPYVHGAHLHHRKPKVFPVAAVEKTMTVVDENATPRRVPVVPVTYSGPGFENLAKWIAASTSKPDERKENHRSKLEGSQQVVSNQSAATPSPLPSKASTSTDPTSAGASSFWGTTVPSLIGIMFWVYYLGGGCRLLE